MCCSASLWGKLSCIAPRRICGGMYPLGYSTPEPQTLLHIPGQPPVAPREKHMHDPSLQLTDERQRLISHKAATGEFPARKAGRSGECMFLKKLRYTNANNLFLVPAAHALLHGLVKDFWSRMLEKVCPWNASAVIDKSRSLSRFAYS